MRTGMASNPWQGYLNYSGENGRYCELSGMKEKPEIQGEKKPVRIEFACNLLWLVVKFIFKEIN